MNLHANAKLGPKGRLVICRRVLEDRWSLTEAAEAAGVSERTAGKWVARYRAEGEAGLLDRSSAPRRVHNATPIERVEAIAALRRLRLTGPEIAETLEMATSTVSAVLRRIGLGKLSRLEPPEPVRRYERSRPGELIHIDVKKLGRIEGGAGTGSLAVRRSATPNAATPRARIERASAGSASTFASTTPPAWPTSRSFPTRRQRPRSASCGERSPSTAPTASRSRG
jgi:transposase